MRSSILATLITVAAATTAQAGQVSVISPPAIVVVIPPTTPVVVPPSTPVVVPPTTPVVVTPSTPVVVPPTTPVTVSPVTPVTPGGTVTASVNGGSTSLGTGASRTGGGASSRAVAVSLPSLQGFNVGALSLPQMQTAVALIQGVLASPPAGLTPAQAATLRNQMAQMQAMLGQ
ncbi:hypothetical protein DL237_18890 [Pseudooceanicola sediminis]|uniref:Uncharacterized protein n=1 Tax=Pseudooceanicola sediminis TaxID=2211117 RepID=A0A399IVG2_9RHOB|nr:hypothetical protein [Pseudooceanicola sediminis]KAA2311687.1 hypothetical protein E0K93_19680 [Puniceibacterium sp. HSS470]RII37148.1 hypothetical protein DL237_18890 [Pseudooceanicola sediminis]|tara:strand:+ start:6898 stop:7419 length:522 start_codon:yes stop_codon:yes gene_type:complete